MTQKTRFISATSVRRNWNILGQIVITKLFISTKVLNAYSHKQKTSTWCLFISWPTLRYFSIDLFVSKRWNMFQASPLIPNSPNVSSSSCVSTHYFTVFGTRDDLNIKVGSLTSFIKSLWFYFWWICLALYKDPRQLCKVAAWISTYFRSGLRITPGP